MKTSISAALGLFALLAATGCQREPTPSEKTEQAIVEALSKQEKARVEIVEVTHETREGHAVSCGFYRPVPKVPTPAGAPIDATFFGWMDGRLTMQVGPRWTPVTLCLVEHYGAPLP